MEEVIKLLTEKNICLNRFVDLNTKEIDFIVAGNFDNLERFYAAREGLLEIIQRVDEMIGIASLGFDEGDTDAEAAMQVKKCMQQKDQIVKRILAQDIQILSKIDSAKSEIIKELSETKTIRKAIGSYKSGQNNQKLDEEA